jgi:hypothetical protein
MCTRSGDVRNCDSIGLHITIPLAIPGLPRFRLIPVRACQEGGRSQPRDRDQADPARGHAGGPGPPERAEPCGSDAPCGCFAHMGKRRPSANLLHSAYVGKAEAGVPSWRPPFGVSDAPLDQRSQRPPHRSAFTALVPASVLRERPGHSRMSIRVSNTDLHELPLFRGCRRRQAIRGVTYRLPFGSGEPPARGVLRDEPAERLTHNIGE